jgi:hypothetical protein
MVRLSHEQEANLKRHYTLNAEPGHYRLTGSPTQGILGATYTGRSIDVEGLYPEAKRWVESFETSEASVPELESELLGSLAPSEGEVGVLFRGRLLGGPPGSLQDFGPPSPDRATRGRYNAAGVPVLYLCSSVNGVARELGPPPSGHSLWVQRFRMPAEFRLADARRLAIDSLSAAVFWLIESGRDRSSPPPLLGQRVGQVIGAAFDGLIVPGVRGAPDELYYNVVVFHPGERWVPLIDGRYAPENAA